MLPRPCVYLVTDRRRLAPSVRTTREEVAALERQLDEAIEAGVDAIQIRERDLDARVAGALAARTVSRSRGTATRVLINDRADVAAAAGADGVHLTGESVSGPRVRALDPDWIVGRSVHAGDAGLADVEAIDYLIFGTVFQTSSKPVDWRVAGIEGLRRTVAATARPVVAIGGITVAMARACIEAGAAGAAAIELFLPPGHGEHAMGVAAAVRELRAVLAPFESNLLE